MVDSPLFTNTSSAFDRFIGTSVENKMAFHWEGEREESFSCTFGDMYRLVCRFAGVLTKLGATKGSIVPIYLPSLPETIAAMHACYRIGALHLIIDCTNPNLLEEILEKTEATLLLTADATQINGCRIDLKEDVDHAITPFIDHVIVLKRMEGRCALTAKRDRWYHELMAQAPKEHTQPDIPLQPPQFLHYAKGTIFTVPVQESESQISDTVHFCDSPISSLNWPSHSYSLISQGVTQVLFEGNPKNIERFHVVN
jgi:acetyl-CoA synthetase